MNFYLLLIPELKELFIRFINRPYDEHLYSTLICVLYEIHKSSKEHLSELNGGGV